MGCSDVDGGMDSALLTLGFSAGVDSVAAGAEAFSAVPKGDFGLIVSFRQRMDEIGGCGDGI